MKIPPSLGRYEVVDLIGQGGMGALYRARDPRIGRYVAIKLLRPGYDTPELRDRFSREARAAGSLSHPNIVTIYDVGEHDGLPFIAMEYVRGETFADLVCLRPPLSVLRKVQLTEEVCAGLAHAHEAGIVHRDIKPANLIVGPEGTVKILDFGIAKLTATGITLPGAIMGTFNYMSPEQVKGTPVDARADIFSVGAVLYELLTHQLAFPGQLPDEVLHQILNGVPKPITDFCPDIDLRLVRLVDRALEKDPDDRFQDIASVQKELASIRLSPQAAVLTPPPVQIPASKTPIPADRDAARLRAQRIEELLIAARHAFEAGDHDAAIESCKQVLLLDASEERAISLIDRVHGAIDEEQIQTQLAEVRHHLSRGATKAARKSLDSASQLSQSHPEIAIVRDEVLIEEARVRTAAVRAAIDRARLAYEADDLTSALRDVQQALLLDPQNVEAQALGLAAEAAIKEKAEQARIRAAVDNARRRFVKGEHQAALQSLEALQPASNPLVAGALEELRLALLEIEEKRRDEAERAERQRRISALLADARAALKKNRLDEASQALEQIRQIDRAVPELADLTERVLQAQAAARLQKELERTLRDFDEQLTQENLPRAGELLKTAASLSPKDSQVRAARKRFEQAMAALAAREAAEARRREGEQKIDDAAKGLENGDLAGAANLLKLAGELVPQHPRAGELSERLREALAQQAAAEAAEHLKQQIEELIRSASQRLQSADDTPSDLVLALREVNQALALDPENAGAPALKTAIEESIAVRREAARARAAISNARTRFANGKHQAALRLLEEYQPSSHPEIADTLSELRGKLLEIEEQRRAEQERIERQQRVAALLAEARTALRDQQFDAARGVLSKVAEIDPAVPELSDLTKRVDQEEAAARLRADLERMLADLNESVTRGDLAAASDLLNAATALSPTDAGVQTARQQVEQARAAREAAEARAREVEEKNAAAEKLFEEGDLQGARGLLTQAAALDGQHARTVLLSERVADAIAQREAIDAAERLRRTIDELLAAAAEILQSADHQAHDAVLAMQKITQALGLDASHAGALALKAQAEAAIAAQREEAFVRAAVRNARNRFANGKHQAALQLLENLDAAAHPLVADTLTELRGALQEIQERRRAEQELAERQRQAAERLAADKDRTDTQEDATRVVLVRGADAKEPGAAAQDQAGGAHDLTMIHARTPSRDRQVEPAARPLPWGLILGVGMLLLAILAALFLLSRRPARALAPHETTGTAVRGPVSTLYGSLTLPS